MLWQGKEDAKQPPSTSNVENTTASASGSTSTYDTGSFSAGSHGYTHIGSSSSTSGKLTSRYDLSPSRLFRSRRVHLLDEQRELWLRAVQPSRDNKGRHPEFGIWKGERKTTKLCIIL